MALNTQNSVVDLMKSKGMDSSYSSRSKLANQYGIKDYKSTVEQNKELLGRITAPPTRSASASASATSQSNAVSGTRSGTISANASNSSSSKSSSLNPRASLFAGSLAGEESDQPNKWSNGKGGTYVPRGTPNKPDTTGMTEEEIAQLIQDSVASNNENLMNNFNQMFQGGQQSQNDLMNMMMTMFGQGGMGMGGDWQKMYGDMQAQFQQLQEQLAYFKMLQQYYQTYQGQGNSMKYSPFM